MQNTNTETRPVETAWNGTRHFFFVEVNGETIKEIDLDQFAPNPDKVPTGTRHQLVAEFGEQVGADFTAAFIGRAHTRRAASKARQATKTSEQIAAEQAEADRNIEVDAQAAADNLERQLETTLGVAHAAPTSQRPQTFQEWEESDGDTTHRR